MFLRPFRMLMTELIPSVAFHPTPRNAGSVQVQTDVLSLTDTLSPLLLPAAKRKRAMTSLVLPLSMNGRQVTLCQGGSAI